MTTTSPVEVIVASVHCDECDDVVEVSKNIDKFAYCSCRRSWVKGFHSMSGHSTSIFCNEDGQLYWDI